MTQPTNRNVIVTGTAGSWINVVSNLLHGNGWSVLWPEQDVDITDGRLFFKHNHQNVEVENIHRSLCDSLGISLFSLKLPTFYEAPYPGPAEFISKFDRPVLISGLSMAPFLDIWVGVADVVIDVRATDVEDIQCLGKWTTERYDEAHLREMRHLHISRYTSHLKLFPKVFTISNAEVKDQRLQGLDDFLKSVF